MTPRADGEATRKPSTAASPTEETPSPHRRRGAPVLSVLFAFLAVSIVSLVLVEEDNVLAEISALGSGRRHPRDIDSDGDRNTSQPDHDEDGKTTDETDHVEDEGGNQTVADPFGRHPFCPPEVWNAYMSAEIQWHNGSNRTLAHDDDDDDAVAATCPDVIQLVRIGGGRSNPMHNYHDYILPLHLLVRLCGHAQTHVLVPYRERWGQQLAPQAFAEPQWEDNDNPALAWLPFMLSYVLTDLIPHGRYISSTVEEPHELQSCYRRLVRFRPKYVVEQRGLCAQVVRWADRLECLRQEGESIRRMNHVLRTKLQLQLPPPSPPPGQEDDGQRRVLEVLLYDRTERRVNGRSWINANESVALLKESVPGVDLTHLTSFEMPPLEQCRVMAEADIVISPHGGNLANMICMRAGAGLVEVKKYCLSNQLAWHRGFVKHLAIKHRQVGCRPLEDRKRWVDPDHVLRAVLDIQAQLVAAAGKATGSSR